ncbi:hypothetical protein LCGC14_0455200 [marine sediment metagenome]|uniref:Uncharacterized protein n=1 Tax=marine sediment metagenome TaxID=412755 RepID=A0A0F9V3G7_9ZZZZ
MNKRDRKAIEKKRRPKPIGPITRRQQVAAVRQIKGQEIAAAVADNIREAVSQEVETRLQKVMDTILSLLDRVVDLEARQHAVLMKRVQDDCDSPNRQERAEGSEVQQDVEMVQRPCFDGASDLGQD